MADKCPICFRNLGVWKNDPILLPKGAKYDWISDVELVYVSDEDDRWYKGVQQITADEIIEIRTTLINLEITYLPTIQQSEFSPLNISGKFQITGLHIKEMRESIEKLIVAFGITKQQYFNFDEEGNHIIHPLGDKLDWTDPIDDTLPETELINHFQVKYIHLEDLRHYLTVIEIEKFNQSDVGIIPVNPIIGQNYSGGYFYGDIGNKPTITEAEKPWFCHVYSPEYPNTKTSSNVVAVPYPGGMWLATDVPTTYDVPISSTAEIIEDPITLDCKLKSVTQLSGTVFDSQTYPEPNGWYPSGTFYWYGSFIVYTSGGTALSYFDGIFKVKRPIITESKIFNIDLNPAYVVSNIVSNYGGTVSYDEYPQIAITINVVDKPLGTYTPNSAKYYLRYKMSSPYLSPIPFTPSFTFISNDTYDYRYLTDLTMSIDNIVQLDVWEYITKRLRDTYFEVDSEGNPVLDSEGNKIGSMKYIVDVKIQIDFNQMFLGVGGALGATKATGSATGGNITLITDNIGLVLKS